MVEGEVLIMRVKVKVEKGYAEYLKALWRAGEKGAFTSEVLTLLLHGLDDDAVSLDLDEDSVARLEGEGGVEGD